MNQIPDLSDLLHDFRRVEEIPAEIIPVRLGELESLKARLWTRLLGVQGSGNSKPQAAEDDRLLTPKEAAPLLGVTPKWLYRHHKRLPFTRRLSRKALRFSEVGLRKWLAAKRA